MKKLFLDLMEAVTDTSSLFGSMICYNSFINQIDKDVPSKRGLTFFILIDSYSA